jgi:sugar phosphate isomerase/epimerase
MRRSDLTICLITDEVSPSLDEGLAFAREEGIGTVDLKVHVENEGVCNIQGFAELEALMTAYRHPRPRALPDIANAYRKSKPPTAADLARLLPFSDILHIKDYANAAGRFVAIGEGDIPIASLLAATLPTREAPLTLTIETHASSEPVATTRRSVNGLRRVIDSIGRV